MRNPGDGMPVGHVCGAEGPGNILGGQTRLNMRIVAHISGIVVIDKTIRKSRPVRDNCNYDEEQRKQPRGSGIVDGWYGCTLVRIGGGCRFDGEGRRAHSFTMT